MFGSRIQPDDITRTINGAIIINQFTVDDIELLRSNMPVRR